MEATLPVKPAQSVDKSSQKMSQKPTQSIKLMSVKANTIVLPGEYLELETDVKDQTILAEGWLPGQWPEPQLTTIAQGKIKIQNNTEEQVLFTNKRAKTIKLTATNNTDWTQSSLSSIRQEPGDNIPLSDSETIDGIKIGNTTSDIKDLIHAAHRQFRKVFSKDLTGGYNGYYGHHEC